MDSDSMTNLSVELEPCRIGRVIGMEIWEGKDECKHLIKRVDRA